MVDFNTLLQNARAPRPIIPKEIFETCLRSEKYAYLRGDQQQILDNWFPHRNNKDSIVKMNTGAGKTAVGLLQLQSSMNEGIGPALYLCLNNQLVEQVLSDANDLGVKCVKFEPGDYTIPAAFLNGQAILVSNLQKLFNAKSIFGVQGGTRPPINVGAIVVDDAHAAVANARETFTLKFSWEHSIYKQLIPMFAESLKAQSLGTAIDILERNDRYAVLMVPYWGWQERIAEVVSVISQDYENDDELKFKWPIVRDNLAHYYALVSSDRLEIMPKCLPIQKIPSFFSAKRRIFMSATLNDDSVLIRDFQVAPASVLNPLSASTQSDVGEKMVLAPYNLDRTLDQEIIASAMSTVKNYNIVVLVGSDRKAQFWVDKGFSKPASSTINSILDQLIRTKGNHVVLSNRYDGIDLPGDICRILIIDDLPSANTLFEQYSMYARPSSKLLRIAQAQKIEQGLGRAVRSVNDYCVILLCGRDLVAVISTHEFQQLLSPPTVEQIKLGNSIVELMKQEHAEPLKILVETMKKVLNRDPAWMQLHKQAMSGAMREARHSYLVSYADAERRAFDLACLNRAVDASDTITQTLNEIRNLEAADKGWYLQLAASYCYSGNRDRAMDIQLSAHEQNTYLLKPPQGVRYQRLTRKETQQATRIAEFLRRYTEWNGLIMHINNVLDKLVFAPDSARSFEKAMKEIGECLGFETQQPEKEFGYGSDVLWNLYDDTFFVIEAKNEVLLTRDVIYKSEAEQLSNSINWFREVYPDKSCVPVLIHPCKKTNREAYPPEGTMVWLPDCLQQFRDNVREFFGCLAQRSLGEWTAAKINAELRNYKLDRNSINGYLKPVD